jgi:hypothetical protein
MRVAGCCVLVGAAWSILRLALTLGRGLDGPTRSDQIPPAIVGLAFALASLVVAIRSNRPGPLGPLWVTTVGSISAAAISLELSFR